MWKDKLGNYLIDISKYVLIGVVISSFFRDFGDSMFLVYGLGVIASVVSLALGLVLTNKKRRISNGSNICIIYYYNTLFGNFSLVFHASR